VKGFANTKYYQAILEERGSCQAWAATSRKWLLYRLYSLG
jgi:hypothetical protein